jgi:hypothetical protein
MVDVEPSILGKLSLVNTKSSDMAEGSDEGEGAGLSAADGETAGEFGASPGPLPLQAKSENINRKNRIKAAVLFIFLLQLALLSFYQCSAYSNSYGK